MFGGCFSCCCWHVHYISWWSGYLRDLCNGQNKSTSTAVAGFEDLILNKSLCFNWKQLLCLLHSSNCLANFSLFLFIPCYKNGRYLYSNLLFHFAKNTQQMDVRLVAAGILNASDVSPAPATIDAAPFQLIRRLIKRRRRLSKALDLAGLEAPWMKIKRRDEWDRFFKTFFKDDFDTKLDIFPKNSLGKIILLCKSLAFTAKFEICNFSLSSILMTFFSDF